MKKETHKTKYQANPTKRSLVFFLFISSFLLVMAALNSVLSVSITIPEEYATIYPGEKGIFFVKILNRGATQREDVILTFSIKNQEKEEIKRWTKTVAIETQLSLYEEFTIPKESEEGLYETNVLVESFTNQTARASQSFHIAQISEDKKDFVQIGLIALVVLLTAGLIYEHRRVTKLTVGSRKLKSMVKR